MTRVTLLLAYAADRPEGDIGDRLEIAVELTANGALDGQALPAGGAWVAQRTAPDGGVRELELVRIDEGWALTQPRA